MGLLDRRSASRRRGDHERDRLFALSADMLAVAGMDGMFSQLNESWERVTGYTLDELKARPIIDLVSQDDQPAFAKSLEDLRKGGAERTIENRCRLKSGGRRWFQWNLTPDAENECLYVAARDIMGRKLAEAESARLAAIVESSNDAIVSASLAGVIESWNPAAERIFGYRASEALGKPLTMLVPRLSTDQTPKVLGQVAGGGQITNMVAERRRKDGTMVTVSLTLSPVRDALGAVIATSVIARDVTPG